jgi:hypothetical protein
MPRRDRRVWHDQGRLRASLGSDATLSECFQMQPHAPPNSPPAVPVPLAVLLKRELLQCQRAGGVMGMRLQPRAQPHPPGPAGSSTRFSGTRSSARVATICGKS